MIHSSLEGFARWFIAQPIGALRPPHGQLSFYMLADASQNVGGPTAGLVLHRDGDYQAELFLLLPTNDGFEFPAHKHPDVDSYEYFLSGPIGFNINGRPVADDAHVKAIAEDGASFLCGRYLRVNHSAPHGARVGKEGGAFISLQRWLNGVKPTSVGMNWDGLPHLATSSEMKNSG